MNSTLRYTADDWHRHHAAHDPLAGFEEAEARGTIPAFIAALAQHMADGDDFVEDFEGARNYLTRPAFVALADALDLCPDHIADAQSCRDDQFTCHVTACTHPAECVVTGDAGNRQCVECGTPLPTTTKR